MNKVLGVFIALFLLTGCSITINTNSDYKDDESYKKACCMNEGGTWVDGSCNLLDYTSKSYYEDCINNK